MLEFLKEYIVNEEDYGRIITTLSKSVEQALYLAQNVVKENIELLISLNLYDCIVNIILYRPDLLLLNTEILNNSINKIDLSLLKSTIKNNINNLVLLGL